MDMETIDVPLARTWILRQPLYFGKKERSAPAGIHERLAPEIRIGGVSLKERVSLRRRFKELLKSLTQIVGHLESDHRTHSHFVRASKLGLNA